MTIDIVLREVRPGDLPILFDHQNDPEANRMAAFPARDRDAFMAHWKKIMKDEGAILRTILWDGRVAGNIVGWTQDGHTQIGYWIGREFWGRGVATAALTLFLETAKARPLYAHVAKRNLGSIRVLEKCGFVWASEGKTPDDDPNGSVDELVMMLE
jgi:RimJ/RimL family protein N-acetyltransferase